MPTTAIAHPNVALIKYWGKRETSRNVPAVGSLSLTMGALRTETTVSFDASLDADRLTLNGVAAPAEAGRLTRCLDELRALAGEKRFADVRSSNDFPTGAGLASSASGYAALAVAAAAELGVHARDPRLAEIARIGSGSAARSLFGGFVELRMDSDAMICRSVLEPDAWPLDVVVAITSEAPKNTSSRDGMERTRKTSPYYPAWIESHARDMDAARAAIEARDFERLAELAEHSCLKMHGLMFATRPPLIYWSPVTLTCIHAIGALRARDVPVFFTVDAGPQVKAVCLPEATGDVVAALQDVPGVLRVIAGGLGHGARVVPAGAAAAGE